MEDQIIIEALKQGDKKALSDVMHKYQQYVYNILITMLTKNEAEEAVQDTFIKVYKRIESYNNTSKFSTWLYSITYRTGLDYLRKRKKTEDIDGSFLSSKYVRTEETVTASYAKEETEKKVEKLMEALSPEDATLVKLYYLEEKQLKEVAIICGISESNAKVKLFRIRKDLRKRRSKLMEA